MVIEGGVSLTAGVAARSVALVAFGTDSLIELASDIIVGWRLRVEQQGACAARVAEVERKTARWAGALLWLLAAYVAVDASRRLLGFGERAEVSPAGIGITVAALVVMPLLARGKLSVANALDSAALRADACEAVCCAWLSAATLAGLALNALFHWWWADPAAALVIVPLLVREGLAGWRGGDCCAGSCSG